MSKAKESRYWASLDHYVRFETRMAQDEAEAAFERGDHDAVRFWGREIKRFYRMLYWLRTNSTLRPPCSRH